MSWTRHPLVLLASLLIGAALGALSPQASTVAALVGRLFGNLMELAALPLLGVATVFGVRNFIALPQRGRRLALMLGTAAIALWGCGLLGAFAGALAGLGRHLDDDALRGLGRLVQQTGGGAGRDVFALVPNAAERAAEAAVGPERARLDNVFALMVQGNLPALVGCAAVFGLAFASLGRERNRVLAGQLEAVYRACERLIALAIHLLPLLALGLAAQITATLDAHTLALLAGPLLVLLGSGVAIALLALAEICRVARCGPLRALAALKAPMFIALVAPSPVAAIPATIAALSEKLGLARGITELLVPAGAVLLRAGTALHAAVIAVFVAGLYGHAPGLPMLAWIGTLAAAASLVAVPGGSVGGLAAAGALLGWLKLPGDALLPVLLLVDRLCVGPRQLVGTFCLGAIVARASAGLPSERRETASSAVSTALCLSLSRATLALAVGCVLLAAALSIVVGMGIGLRVGA